MRTRTAASTLAAAILLATSATGVARAQWVSFTDETGARLMLQPFVDDPTGNPMEDDQEKDVAVGDLDKDGSPDVVVVRKRPFSNPGTRQDVLLMNEGGVLVDRTATFAPGFLSVMTDARDVHIADVTGDTWPDVVIANTFGQQPKLYRNLGEDGGGNWLGLIDESEARLPFLAPIKICAVWAGDVTGDGALDLYFANYEDNFSGTVDFLLINDGSGTFTDETVARLGNYRNSAFGTAAEIHDVDNDGDNDIIKISTLYSAPPFDIGQFILFNDGNGVFKDLPFETMPSDAPYQFAAGHLNGDNRIDFLQVGDTQDFTAINTSSVPNSSVEFSTFSLNPSPRTSGFGGNTKLADIDGDGDLDGGVAPVDVDIQNCPDPGDLALLRNDGSGKLSDPWPANDDQNIHVGAHDFGFLDLDGDGCLDLFAANCTGWNVFLQDDCSPSAAPTIELTAGSCGGTVTIVGSGFTPDKEVGLVGAANLDGFVKGGSLCPGATFEVGEPFDLPPTFAKTNAEGKFQRTMETEAGFCWIEALDLLGTCQTSNVIDVDVDSPPTAAPADGL